MPRYYEGTEIEVEVQEEGGIGCFTLIDDGHVICPMGQTLSRIKNKGESAAYATNKDACGQCQNYCTRSKNHKTALFGPGTKHVAGRMYENARHLVIQPAEGSCFPKFVFRKD